MTPTRATAAQMEKDARKVLRGRPNDPAAVRDLAIALQLQERYEDALAAVDAVLTRLPRHREALLARGDVLFAIGHFEESLSLTEQALAQGEDLATLIKLGLSLKALGRYREALAAFDRALARQPDQALARFQRGLLRLQLRDFAQGWDDYEARWDNERFIRESRGFVAAALVPELVRAPSAESLTDQRVLLIGEQGVGDQVMFASMIPDLASVARSVVCVCEPRLVKLLRASFPGVAFSGPADARIDVESIDKVVAVGSLGAAFRRTEAAFPCRPYLAPPPEAVTRWAGRLGPRRGRLRIGISWRGGAATTRRLSRSLELDQLRPVLDLPDCEFVSLQYGDVSAEVQAFSAGRADTVRTFAPAEISDFEDLAGLVANLDVVVSVQNTLVHLCGALGTPCLTLVPTNPEWRYLAEGETMPWYGSVRLFRQAQGETWAAVVARVAEAAAQRTPR